MKILLKIATEHFMQPGPKTCAMLYYGSGKLLNRRFEEVTNPARAEFCHVVAIKFQPPQWAEISALKIFIQASKNFPLNFSYLSRNQPKELNTTNEFI